MCICGHTNPLFNITMNPLSEGGSQRNVFCLTTKPTQLHLPIN